MSSKGFEGSSSSDDEATMKLVDEILKHSSSKTPPTARELRVLEAAKYILRESCGVISPTLLNRTQINAAELLVEDHLLVCVDNLFEDIDDIDVYGYVKMVPNEIDLNFVGRLINYGMTWETYLKNISIPDIWKNRLSAKGIHFLSEMAFYRKLLNISDQPSIDIHVADRDHDKLEKQFSLNTRDTIIHDESLNVNQCTEQILFDNVCTSTPKRSMDHENNSTKDHVVTFDESISTNNTKTNNIEYISNTKPSMDWNKLRENIVGLNNLDAASCYINAALQCLASTPPLVDWMIKEKNHVKTCVWTNNGSFCSICQLSTVIYTISPFSKQNVNNKDPFVSASADGIRNNLSKISASFNIDEQEDANLFIVSLLDHCAGSYALHMSVLSAVQPKFNFIDRIFRITLLNTIECFSCSYTSTKEEYTYTLSIEINNMNNLSDALEHFVKPEILTGDNSYRCNSCDAFVQATKRFTINDLPPILIINLKRSVGFGSSTRKQTQHVDFNEFLNVHPYVTDKLLDSNKENQNNSESNNYFYRLYAVINHISNTNENGHYHAYVRTCNDIWFLVNDTHYQHVSLEQVLNNKDASIFFYGKTSHKLSNINRVSQRKPLQCSSIDNSLILTPTISNISITKDARHTNIYSTTSPTVKQLLNSNSQPDTNATSKTIDKYINKQLTTDSNIEISAGYTESSITIGNQSSNKISEKQTPKINRVSNKRSIDDVTSSSTQTSVSSKRIHKSFTDTWESMNSDTSRIVASVAAGVPLQEVFECTLPRTHKCTLSSTSLINLHQYRRQILNQEHDATMKKMGLLPVASISLSQEIQSNNRSNSTSINQTKCVSSTEKSDKRSTRKVNIEYFNIIAPYLKRYNPYCGLCICTRNFGHDLLNPNHYIVKCTLKCNGKDCKFLCRVYVLNNGECLINALNNTVYHHVTERIARPIRGSKRKEIKEKFKGGSLVYQLHGQYSDKRTTLEKMGFNYDTTGKSKKIFKKIKAEVVAESLLSPNVISSISQLAKYFIEKTNPSGTVPGALQFIQIQPFCITVFTEASILLYDAIVTHKDSVLSWDATGGVVKNTGSKEILYYELTITHPNIVDEDSLIPLTFMLSESQSLFTVTQWLSSFKDHHRKIFPHKKDSFPRPAIILSDRAQIFLQAALRVCNDENYQQFLSRAYRIVTKKAIQDDFFKTNIHACLAHFMLDMRKRVNKHLPDGIREFAMWSVALLVNSNTYEQIKDNWRLICQVFLNYTTNTNSYFNKYYAILLSRISEITSDPNASKAISKSKETVIGTADPYEFDENDTVDDDEGDELHSNKHVKTSRKAKRSSTSHVINEEKELNEMDSPFKHDLNNIYYECCEESIKVNGAPSSTDKVSKGSRTWLSFINQRCMPTVPIWSNLLLGNLSRHGQSSVRAFDSLLVSTHDQRTNAISERRMGIVKRTQLSVETRIRADVVLHILINDMVRLVANFSVSYMASMSQTTHSENHTQLELRDVQEHWRQSSRRGYGHYCKAPNESIVNTLKNALIVRPSNINASLSIPTLAVPNWFNVIIALLLSIKVFRETLPESTSNMSPILIEILGFIKNWMCCLDRIKPPKKTSAEQKQLLNTHFNLPSNVPIDIDLQIIFILDKILIPLLAPSISVKIIYTCTSCKFITEMKSNINYILIHTMNNQFNLYNQLSNYFIGSISDYKCNKCNSSMSRHVKIIDCPSVIIVKIDHDKDSRAISCKTPETICFDQFLDKSSIGCATSTVFDVVGFSAVNLTADKKEKKLVSLTKVKERWYFNSVQKKIGNGSMFVKLFATSRIIILERIRTCSSDFLYAIAQCCSIIINSNNDSIKPYKTLRDAIRVIENNEQFNELRHLLLSTCVTYYICNKCNSSLNLLSSSSESIFIYEQNSENNEIYGTPLLSSCNDSLDCSVCNEKTKNLILPVHKQINIKCPSILMLHLSGATIDTLTSFHVKLTDHLQTQHVYKPISALLIDEYNALSVIKLKGNVFYSSSPYDTPVSVSKDEINDSFYTARALIVFMKKELNKDISSSPEISPLQQPTTTTASDHVIFNQPLAVQFLDKTTNKFINGSVRSLVIQRK